MLTGFIFTLLVLSWAQLAAKASGMVNFKSRDMSWSGGVFVVTNGVIVIGSVLFFTSLRFECIGTKP